MTRLQRITIAALLGATVWVPALACADEGDIVVTASGIEQPRSEVGQAITVISRDDMESRQAAILTDILSEVPGVAVARDGGFGAKSSAFIRGANSSQTLVLIDGVRVNDPSTPNAQYNFGALTIGNIDRVEVLRGPNSVIWGSQAIGGVINIRNAAPGDRPELRAMAEGGSYGTFDGSVNASGTVGPVAASLGASHYRTDGFSALSTGTERDPFDATSLNGRLNIALSGQVSLDLRAYYNRSNVGYDDIFAGIDTPSKERNRQLVLYAGINASLLDGKLRQRIAYSRTDIDRDGTDPRQPVLFTNYSVYTVKGLIDRFEYQGSFDLGRAVTLVAGAEHERDKASSLYPANGTNVPDRAVVGVTSFYGQTILRPVTGLTVTGGVRHDDYDVYGGQTTFGANLAYSPNRGRTFLRGTYAEGFRAPSLVEALLPFGNRSLKPETAKSYDVGIEQWLIDGKASVSVTWFHRNSHDQIAYNFTTFQSENIERVRSRGVELALMLHPVETLSLSGNYSFVNARDLSTGNQLELRPRHLASISIDWTSPVKVSLGATVRIVGDSFNDRANTQPLDGYSLTSIRAAYPLLNGLELYGRVENLFDTRDVAVRGYGVPGRAGYVGLRFKI